MNATRYSIGNALKTYGLPITFWTGGRTKFNRCGQGYPKDHWIDAVCVGKTGATVFINPEFKPLMITAMGRGSRQMCRVNKYGFPRTKAKQKKRVYGFQTGDNVKAVILRGKHTGTYVGRVAVRTNGSFNIKVGEKTLQGISHLQCRITQRVDRYRYRFSSSFYSSLKDGDKNIR